MKIAILAAMDKELNLLLNLIPEREELHIDENVYYKGNLHNHIIIVGKCGIGKVNSALNTYSMIQSQHPDLVINSGVAGGVDGSLSVGSVLIADGVAYHDVWCGPDTVYGAADGFPQILLPDADVISKAHETFADNSDVKFGLICSGDKFIHLKEEVDTIKKAFNNALAVDIESAS
ncbi:MAG: 5'-methylthioadenosine/S-adenosylhomocysteine nucleosidase, partial [Muribaculaceae bacterium]|nr:5'-methylthioadenosine/S-adenosylhomocysteine nucleosidase [Muribaculaceae bacterium]